LAASFLPKGPSIRTEYSDQQWFDQYSQVGKVLDQLLDAGLELRLRKPREAE
jgi:hypothetical protein